MIGQKKRKIELEGDEQISSYFKGTIFDVSVTNQYFAVASETKASLFDLKTSKLLFSQRVSTQVTRVLIYKDLLIFSSQENIFMLNIYTLKLVKNFKFPMKNIWGIHTKNEKIFFPTNNNDLFIYDEKTEKFDVLNLSNGFISLCFYEDLFYVTGSNQSLQIRDFEKYQVKKEVKLKIKAWSITSNNHRVFIGGDNGEIHVYDHDFNFVKIIDFSETTICVWMNVLNEYLICGSTWGSRIHVMIYNLKKEEKILLPNPNEYGIWCVVPVEREEKIYVGNECGIMIYNFNFSELKPQFTGKIENLSDICWKFRS